MNELTTLPNIGKTLTGKLQEVGIKTISDLRNIGAEEAFIRLAAIDSSACINMLYALEGAIQEIRWHHLPSQRKQELLEFFRFCKSQSTI